MTTWDLWYKNGLVYCVDVRTFMDGNGDGVGDFAGLRSRLDYLAGLGVTCLWLLPFYGSPGRDNGYDVSDYYAVDPQLGSLGDFVEFSHAAALHGIRVVVDLVANHTSDEHPWFEAARSDPRSPFRDWYCWSKERPENHDEGQVFPGVQETTWTWDEEAGAYYFHRFFPFQPDLNVSHPAVRAEILKVMGFWLELGVSGFRVDAVPFLIEHPPGGANGRTDMRSMLTDMREFLSWRRGDAILLAEANVALDEVEPYFADGTRFHMVFHFIANQQLFLGLADEDATGLARVISEGPRLRDVSQWVHFLRNHDELDLGRLDEEERSRAFAALGPDPSMQLFGRGLRRRLAPMLGGDPRRLALAYSLLLTLPGTPVIWYGEEIGMGEDLALEGRAAVRTPMQWSDDENGGFSRAETLVRPALRDGPYGYLKVNVGAQRRDPDSLLNRVERMIRLRRECRELGWGRPQALETGERSVLAIRYDRGERAMVVLHNLAGRDVRVALSDLPSDALFDALTGERLERGPDRRHEVALEGYGFRWYRVGSQDPAWAPLAGDDA